MDPLEQKINTLKEALQGVEQPDRAVIWQGIARSETAPKKTFFEAHWKWVAATLCLLLWIGFIWWYKNNQERRREDAAIAYLPVEWQVKAREYQVLVRQREQQIFMGQQDNSAIADEIRVLRELDQIQALFLADFAVLPKDHRTAAHYLRYYEQKMRVLELIFKKIDIQKNEEERNMQHRS